MPVALLAVVDDRPRTAGLVDRVAGGQQPLAVVEHRVVVVERQRQEQLALGFPAFAEERHRVGLAEVQPPRGRRDPDVAAPDSR